MRVACNIFLTKRRFASSARPAFDVFLFPQNVSEFLRMTLCSVNVFLPVLALASIFLSPVVAISIRLSFFRNRPVAK